MLRCLGLSLQVDGFHTFKKSRKALCSNEILCQAKHVKLSHPNSHEWLRWNQGEVPTDHLVWFIVSVDVIALGEKGLASNDAKKKKKSFLLTAHALTMK